MKKTLIVLFCVLFLAVGAYAEVVLHSGSRGTGSSSKGKVGDSTHVWNEGHFYKLHFPRRIPVALGSVFVDGGADIDDASTPAITTLDNVAGILYDDSSETTGIQFPWAPSVGYTSGMQLEVVISSDTAAGTAQHLDWQVFVQDDATTFGTAIAQTGVTGTSATLDASNELITLSINTTADAAITAGSSNVVIELWSSGLSGSLGTTEIKAITILEP